MFPRFFPSEWTIESNAVRPSSSFQNRLRKGIKRERESYGEHEADIDRGEREKVREMRRRKERRRKEGRKVFSAVIIGDVSRVVPLGPRQKSAFHALVSGKPTSGGVWHYANGFPENPWPFLVHPLRLCP